jgi:hypothetical protein
MRWIGIGHVAERTSACRGLVGEHEKKETNWKMHSGRIILK